MSSRPEGRLFASVTQAKPGVSWQALAENVSPLVSATLAALYKPLPGLPLHTFCPDGPGLTVTRTVMLYVRLNPVPSNCWFDCNVHGPLLFCGTARSAPQLLVPPPDCTHDREVKALMVVLPLNAGVSVSVKLRVPVPDVATVTV